MIQGCDSIGQTCGEIEYMNPAQPKVVLCAPSLVYLGTEGEQFVFEEQPAFRPAECFPTSLKMTYIDDETLAVEQYPEPDVICCTGDFHRMSETVDPLPPPAGVALDGLEGPTSATDLGGTTTQYVAAGSDGMWFPTEGAVQLVDPGAGEIAATIQAGDPMSNAGDPHSVIAADGSLWVAQLGARSIARVDEASGEVVDTIDLDVAPYAIALDDKDLWVTSFDDSAVVRVDTSLGEQTARIQADSPTGIAVGGGAVWVVQHRSDTVVRIEPTTNEISGTIELGGPGDDPTCGMCVENVVYAHGSLWTANNAGRSVTRVDPESNESLVVPLDHRAWAVTATDDSIWTSQFEDADGSFDMEAGGLARIDPATNGSTQLAFPGTLSVASGHGSLWVVTVGRRSDLVYQYKPEAAN
jgi:streptogramin lyase